MRRDDTSVNPYTPTRTITARGPYRLTRNPIYLGDVIVYAGIAILIDTLWALPLLLLAIATVQRGVILREERYLERRFGEAYLQYKRRVRRWI